MRYSKKVVWKAAPFSVVEATIPELRAALEQIVDNMVMGGNIAMLGFPAGRTEIEWSRIVFKALTIAAGPYGPSYQVALTVTADDEDDEVNPIQTFAALARNHRDVFIHILTSHLEAFQLSNVDEQVATAGNGSAE